MVKSKADSRQRVRIPDIKPGQVFAVDNQGNGRIQLTLVQPAMEETKALKARVVKDKEGFTVVVPGQPINESAIEELLTEFP